MYLMGSDMYECDICGLQEKWDAHDDHRGDMWECESCGKHFCTNCFTKDCGEEAFRKMLSETDIVLCPECWKKQGKTREFRINIRETLETQVTVEAGSKEEALREAERRWKDGEYILNADNFQGVNFWADGLDNLKPCPFCGGRAVISAEPEAVVDTEGRRWGYTVVCNRCCATSGLTYSPDKAREAWNRRAER